MVFIPILSILSMFFGIIGGYIVGWISSEIITIANYEVGLRYYFLPYSITYSVIKSIVFAFIISTTAAYFGYNVKGGALQVGKASTNSVVTSSIMILAFDLILTQLLLA